MTLTRICVMSFIALVVTGCGESPKTQITKPSEEAKPSAKMPEKPKSLTKKKEPETHRPAKITNSPTINRSKILEKRGAVVGKSFKTLTIGGRQYSSATVKNINDAGMKIQHQSGIATIDWKNTSKAVREAWGYDESAYLGFQKVAKTNHKHKAVTQEKKIVTEEEKANNLERKKKKLLIAIDEIEAEISRGTIMLKSFNKTLEVTNAKFAEEDRAATARKRARNNTGEDGGVVSRSIGGVSTSKADRKKNTGAGEARVKNAEIALSKLKTKLEILERDLKNL